MVTKLLRHIQDVFTVPSEPPSYVKVCDVGSSTINLEWGQVNCSHRNGIILGYTVQYEVIGSGNIQYLNVSAIFTVGSINELMPFMTYSISVAAINSAGTGVFSTPIINQTRPSKYL